MQNRGEYSAFKNKDMAAHHVLRKMISLLKRLMFYKETFVQFIVFYFQVQAVNKQVQHLSYISIKEKYLRMCFYSLLYRLPGIS